MSHIKYACDGGIGVLESNPSGKYLTQATSNGKKIMKGMKKLEA